MDEFILKGRAQLAFCILDNLYHLRNAEGTQRVITLTQKILGMSLSSNSFTIFMILVIFNGMNNSFYGGLKSL